MTTFSTKTTTIVASIQVREDEDLYPDVSATTGEVRVNASLVMRLVDVSRTAEDLSDLHKWKYGDKVYGTIAKNDKWGKQYRRDINKIRGKDYEPFYVNTSMPIKNQLKRKRGR